LGPAEAAPIPTMTPAASRTAARPMAMTSRIPGRTCMVMHPLSLRTGTFVQVPRRGVNGERTIAPSGPQPEAARGPAAGHDRAAGRERRQVGDPPGGGRAGRGGGGVDHLLLRLRAAADRGGAPAARGRAGGRAG